MNLLFVNYHDFRGNSAIHIANLADALDRLGFSCSVAVPHKARTTARLFPQKRFDAVSYRRARRGRYGFARGVAPDLIHAWTPRERVRELVETLHSRDGTPYFVHLEDNEEVIAADQLGIPRGDLENASDREIERGLIPTISHPRRYREFLAAAAGVTVIVDRLAEFVPAGVPTHVLWPAFETDLFKPTKRPAALARSIGLDGAARAVVYAGTVHPTNAEEVRNLYLAVATVDTSERPVRLVRLGSDFLDFLGAEAEHARRIEIRVPHQRREDVPSYYALADVLVQPGAPDVFNDYRLPSKLPEYFAMGIPVILPRSNLGLHARDGEECLLLDEGSATDIATKMKAVFDDPALARRLALGARSFAERMFSWDRSARDLAAFYGATLNRS